MIPDITGMHNTNPSLHYPANVTPIIIRSGYTIEWRGDCELGDIFVDCLNPVQTTSESTFVHSALLLVLEHCLWNVPSLRPFVLQVRATCGYVFEASVEWWQRRIHAAYAEENLSPVPQCPL